MTEQQDSRLTGIISCDWCGDDMLETEAEEGEGGNLFCSADCKDNSNAEEKEEDESNK